MAHEMHFTRPDIEEFFRTYAITGFAVSKDEQRIAFATNLSGNYNLWGLDLPNAYPYPLTYEDQTPHDIQFDPLGRYILVGFDTDGDENTQLYLIPPSGGALKAVRTAAARRHYVGSLSTDGNRIYYASDKDNHQFLNGYVYDITTETETVLYEGRDASTSLAAVAEDESSFVTTRYFANTYAPSYLHVDGEVHCLTPDDTVPHIAFSVEYVGHLLFFTTNYEANRSYVASYDMHAQQFTKRFEVEGADCGAVVVHEASRTAYVLAHFGVEDKLFAYNLASDASYPVELPVSVVEEIKVGDSGALYILGRSDVHPFNLYRRSPDGEWTQLTNNRVMGVSTDELVSAEVCTFQSYDGLEMEALWFAAKPETANGYTVVWPHGGPQASERRMFRPFFQFLCSRGYNVWAPNFRGSTGYGAAFVKMVEGDWGHGPRLDMVASVEWLVREGRSNRDKLFLVGGSYGGYMTLLLHGRHAEYWRACVDIFGPCNLFTFLNSVPDHWKPMMKQWLGDVETDKERLTVDSPITYLDQMTKPMLVIQGANDPRVVKAESDQIVAALRDKGANVEYLVFEDEGHGFTKKVNEMEAYRRLVDFLDSHQA